MHAIRFLEPCPELTPYIRFYAERTARLADAEIVHPMPARSMHVIEFLFGDRYTIRDRAKEQSYPAHRGVVVGLQTSRRIELCVHGKVHGFSIFFYGHALRQLLALPVAELTNTEHEAACVGRELEWLGDRLGACRTTQECVAVTDRFFCEVATRVAPENSVVAAARAIQVRAGRCRMDLLARETGVSLRHFERRFTEQVGVGPKLYARIVRFESALERKAGCPRLSWTSIAHTLGYHDQMHMVHDFGRLAGAAPHVIFRELQEVMTPRP